MHIVHTNDIVYAKEQMLWGYEPVELSIGGESLVGPLAMDHHGVESWREGVAIRAYRDYFGIRRAYPDFVVTGAADADATFAIAALAGLLPHPSRKLEFSGSPERVRDVMTRDLTRLAETINRHDTDPIGQRLEETPEGVLLLLWMQLSSGVEDATAFYAGVDRWRALTGGRLLAPLLEAARAQEADRVAVARRARITRVSDSVIMVESAAWSFDVHYELAPCVLAYHDGVATIGCRDKATAERLFGPGGLKNVFPKLTPGGWGGREAVGGSPRGLQLSPSEITDAAYLVASMVLHCTPSGVAHARNYAHELDATRQHLGLEIAAAMDMPLEDDCPVRRWQDYGEIHGFAIRRR